MKYTDSMITKLMNIPGISYILMPFVSTFNVVHDTYIHIKDSVSHAYDIYTNYISNSFNTWYFISDMDYPLQAIYCSNLYEISQWQYNRSGNILSYIRGDSDKYIVGLPFVSIDISTNDGRTFHMDSILEKFMYTTDGVHIPTPQLLMNIWSVHSRILLTEEDKPVMTVITIHGDIETFPVFAEEGDDIDPFAWSEIFRENFEFETNDSSECDNSENHEGEDDTEVEDEDEEAQKSNTIINENDNAEISTSNEVSSEEGGGEEDKVLEETGVSFAHENTNTSNAEDINSTYNIIATPQLSATNPTMVEAAIPNINLTTPSRVTVESVDVSIPSHVPEKTLNLKKLELTTGEINKNIQTFASIANGVSGIEIDYSKVKEIIRNYPMANLQDKNLEEVD